MNFLHKVFKAKEKKVTGKIGPAEKVRDDSTAAAAAIQKKKLSGSRSETPLVKGILLRSLVTEKSNNAVKENKYTFAVAERTNKIEIAAAVKMRYSVDVEAVKVIAGRDKMRSRGRQVGWKLGSKKAVVTLPEGQTIEIQ